MVKIPAMEQVTKNVFAQTKVKGCNPGYVVTSAGVVVIDTPQLPTPAVAMHKEVKAIQSSKSAVTVFNCSILPAIPPVSWRSIFRKKRSHLRQTRYSMDVRLGTTPPTYRHGSSRWSG